MGGHVMVRFVRVAVVGVMASVFAGSCRAPENGAPAPDGLHRVAEHRSYPRAVAPNHVQVVTSALTSSSAPAGAHLNYYGGRVVSNARVVQVLYGTGSYLTQITSTATPSVASFFQGVLNSPYVDWLNEYDTAALGVPSSHQSIGRGSFVSQVTITPSAANNGATIDDANVQSELSAQIQAGTLPAPTQDVNGNNNTYYAVFFPHGKKVTMQGSASCAQFCAYHGTIANAGGLGEVYYGVHPDFQAGSGCESGCGNSGTAFGNVTQVASHELIETITDAEVGLATTFSPPLAWYDTNYGEIGDICNGQHGTIVGGDGVTYDVQTEFSNLAHDCIVSRTAHPTVTVPSAFEGGNAVTSSVSLDAIAPAGGVIVTLTSSAPSLVMVPASVTVAAGSTSVFFQVTSVSTTTETPVVITATFPAATATANVTVLASPTVASVILNPSILVGGNQGLGTVTLTGPAPAGGAAVALASSTTFAASVPASITIAEGASSGTFPIFSAPVSSAQSTNISASFHNTTKAAFLQVTGQPLLQSLGVSPSPIDGGNTATGIVGLSSPALTGGAVVTLTSSNPALASVPATATVVAGAMNVSFAIPTTVASTPTNVTITATFGSATRTAVLTVGPASNAAYDPGLKVPRCTTVASFCDTGTSLINGRANIFGGAEPHTPNTINGSCVDGTAGTYHSDESLDRLRISTVDGSPLAAGKSVRVDATIWMFTIADKLDVYFAPDATAPVWTFMGTGSPGPIMEGQGVATLTFVLPAGTQPAIRANWRYGSAAAPCTTGIYDDHDDLVFAVVGGTPVNQPPQVNAGPDLVVTLPAAASLDGTVFDDGLPSPPMPTALWSMVSGPGAVAFANAGSPATTVTFSQAGTYVLRLTVSDGALSGSDDVTVTVNPSTAVNQPPIANAGPDETFPAGTWANLIGAVTDDGLPSGVITWQWTVVSGPGPVTLQGATTSVAQVQMSVPGVYVLRLTVSDTALSGSDDVQVTVTPGNQPPVVSAGPDQATLWPAPTSLVGSITDDGLPSPPAMFTTTWSLVTGPGTVTFADPHAALTTATFSTPGWYTLRLTANDSQLSSTDDVVIVTSPPPPVNQPPVVSAGPDQTLTLPAASMTLAGDVTDDFLPPPPNLFTTVWSVVSGPGPVTFGNANNMNSTIAFSVAGSYTLRLTANDSQLSSSDDVVITVLPVPNQPPVVSAGPSLVVNEGGSGLLLGSASDDGLPNPPAALTVTWSVLSGPGVATFATPNAVQSTVAFSVTGTYQLRLTVSDGALSTSADVTVWANKRPTVDAGPDQSWFVLTYPTTVVLRGDFTDDWLPPNPGTVTTTWTVVSGPEGVTFDDAHQSIATAFVPGPGVYVFRLTVSDGDATVSDELVATIAVPNLFPQVAAGADQTIVWPAVANLAGGATDDGLPNPPGALTTTWSKVSGPGAVTFANANATSTTATFSVPGAYTLRLSASDGLLTSTADLVVTVVANQAPVVDAGPDQTMVVGNFAQLPTVVTDDGLPNPPAALTYQWTVVSGPGAATFLFPNNQTSPVQLFAVGTYVLRLTVSDGALSTSDDLQITTTPQNQFPVVNAGSDLAATVVFPATLNLAGTASDDGLPNPPGATTVTWSKLSGPGTVTFDDAHKRTAAATFSTAGSYVLRLTATDGALSATDDVAVTLTLFVPTNTAPVVNAGPDQSLTLPAAASLTGAVTDDGLPNPPAKVATTWSKVSGPGTVTFANAAAKATTATFSTSGSYVLRLTATDGTLSANDTLTVVVSAARVNKAPVVSAGSNKTITLPSTASLAGTVTDDGLPNPPGAVTTTWSKSSGPGTVTFANAGAKATTATFSTSGSYVLKLTANDGALSASATLTITVNAAPVNKAPVVSAGPDLTITRPAAASLNGTATDDGLPNPPNKVTTTWSKVSGPGTVTFANAGAKATTATFSAAGTYVLRLTASDGTLSANDTAQLTVK
jgi:hypothetical protein